MRRPWRTPRRLGPAEDGHLQHEYGVALFPARSLGRYYSTPGPAPSTRSIVGAAIPPTDEGLGPQRLAREAGPQLHGGTVRRDSTPDLAGPGEAEDGLVRNVRPDREDALDRPDRKLRAEPSLPGPRPAAAAFCVISRCEKRGEALRNPWPRDAPPHGCPVEVRESPGSFDPPKETVPRSGSCADWTKARRQPGSAAAFPRRRRRRGSPRRRGGSSSPPER